MGKLQRTMRNTESQRTNAPPISSVAASIVNACARDGRGGSPTAVLADGEFSEAERRRIPVVLGTSHVVFVTTMDTDRIGLRFYTSTGELAGCGHGTVAALIFAASRTDRAAKEFVVAAGSREFAGRVVDRDGMPNAAFDPGTAELRGASAAERDLVRSVFGDDAGMAGQEISAASLGRARLLVSVRSRESLARLAPDLDRLRAGCDDLDLLGCYVYSAPGSAGRLAARMFAPSIGVGEDIANANSTACLAVHLAGRGFETVTVDMGDSLGHPATIAATVSTREGELRVLVGGDGYVAGTRELPLADLGPDCP
jgi:trans-2,3-dihydro-3-hydroxyanthranilate isomerase